VTNRLSAKEPKHWAGPELAALIAGALLPLAFAPIGIFPLAWLSPALLFRLWLDAPPAAAARRGFAYGLGMFGVGVSWVYVAIHDFGYTAAPVAALMTLVFVAVLSLYPAVLGALGGWLLRRTRPPAVVSLVLILPALWVLFEWIRGRFLTGFPWLNLGYSHIDTPLAGLAPVAGVYGLSWVVALGAGALAYIGLRKRSRALLALLLPLALLGAGAGLGGKQWSQPAGEPLQVTLVQGNQDQLTKWDAAKVEQRLKTYAELTLPEFGQADLVVWPENAVTLFYGDLRDYFDRLELQARSSGTDLMLGVPLRADDGVNYFTTIMSLGSEHAFYRKRHLVPFGEFVPFQEQLRGLIAFFDLPMSAFSAGPAGQAPLSVAGQRAAVSICYEDAFGEEVIANLADATLLVNGSNNAWYGDSLAPHQHLQISRMRALETGRPLLRATTNGISALVDSKGKPLATSPQFETYLLRGTVQPRTGLTPYTRWGNMPVLAVVILVTVAGSAAGLALGGRKRRHSRGQ